MKKQRLLLALFLTAVSNLNVDMFFALEKPAEQTPANVVGNIVIEAGTRIPYADTFFISPKTAVRFVTDASAIDTADIGNTVIELESDGKTYLSSLTVEDTTPPSGKPARWGIYKGGKIEPENLVRDVRDISEVVCAFAAPPDFEKPGWQNVTVTLTDKGQNVTEINSGFYIFEPPKAVTADDTALPQIPEKETAAPIKPAKPKKTEQAPAKPVTEESVNEMADNILAKIIADDMTERDKAYAIFMWVVKKMKYSAGKSPRELIAGAYACFTKGSGDCYVYRSGLRVLLTRAGIANEGVRRAGGTSDHFWNLVNTGSGWYHVDACANKVLTAQQRFMFTDSQAKEYTSVITYRAAYYEYDESTVPEVVD